MNEEFWEDQTWDEDPVTEHFPLLEIPDMVALFIVFAALIVFPARFI